MFYCNTALSDVKFFLQYFTNIIINFLHFSPLFVEICVIFYDLMLFCVYFYYFFLDNWDSSGKIVVLFYQSLIEMKPKLEDVAKTAGVSLTTASMVLSGKGRISQDTRNAVLSAAAQLGYEKKVKINKSGRTSFTNIAIFVSIDPEWAFIWHFIRPILSELESILRRENYNVILMPLSSSQSNEDVLQKLSDAGVGAVISMHYGNEQLFSVLEGMGIPVVVVMNGQFQDKFYSVCVDDFQGAYEAGLHLIKLGHREIAYIATERPDLPALMSDRYIGLKKALDEHHLELQAEQIITFELNDLDTLRLKLTSLFAGEHGATAFFCLDDDIALRLITALREFNAAIPEQISVIAPGDVLDYDQPHIPNITTMKINTTLMGKISADLLLSRLHHTHDDIHVLKVKQQLVKRESCAPPPDKRIYRSDPV